MSPIAFIGKDGTRFSGFQWLPPQEGPCCRGVVVALHGMGSAAGEFAPLGEYLAERGWVVIAPNQRSNGHDPVVQRRGHSFDYSAYRDDLLAFCETFPPAWRELPVFLLGESMGGLLSVSYLTDAAFTQRCAGLILCAPVFALRHSTPAWIRHLLRWVAQIFPTWVIPPSLFIHGKNEPVPLTRDAVYQEYTLTAPHRVARYTISFTMGVDGLMQRARACAPQLRVPLLLLGGEDDVFISPQQLQTWYETAGSENKTMRIFEGSRHLLLHELNTLEVLHVIHTWLEQLSTSPKQDRAS